MHTLVTIPLVNRYGTRLFVMCVCTPVQPAHPAPPDEKRLRYWQTKKISLLHTPRCEKGGISCIISNALTNTGRNPCINHATASSQITESSYKRVKSTIPAASVSLIGASKEVCRYPRLCSPAPEVSRKMVTIFFRIENCI